MKILAGGNSVPNPFDAAAESSSLAGMSAILSIQSHVVYGHVGNSAAVFPLQRLGREVWPIATVQFSSHAGYPGWRGRAFDAGMIDDCVAGLRAIGALSRCAAVLTGYLGKPEIGDAVLRALNAVIEANPGAVYACDPVIGDDGRGVYVAAGVGEFFRDHAAPKATILTPNAFELQYLTALPVSQRDEARAAVDLLRARGPRIVLVTSLRLEDTPADATDMLVADPHGHWRLRTPKLPIAVNGAGDLLSALFLHHWLRARDAPEALASAASSVYGVVAATAAAGGRELAIVAAQQEFAAPSRRFRPEPL
jgi:pyridoxine kinase